MLILIVADPSILDLVVLIYLVLLSSIVYVDASR